jgi:phosphohistidine phosphatase SixA
MRRTLAALAFLASLMLGSPVHAQIVSDTPSLLLAVRHADTLAERGDRALSDAGISRAQALAVTVRNAGVTAIITTQFRRSRDTAQPTASALGLTPEVIQISRAALDSHLKQLEAAVRKHKGGVVLVVGHEESVTQLIAALGGPRLAVIFQRITQIYFRSQWLSAKHISYILVAANPTSQ